MENACERRARVATRAAAAHRGPAATASRSAARNGAARRSKEPKRSHGPQSGPPPERSRLRLSGPPVRARKTRISSARRRVLRRSGLHATIRPARQSRFLQKASSTHARHRHDVVGRDKKWSKKGRPDPATVATAKDKTSTRIIFVRHGESAWNDFSTSAPRSWCPSRRSTRY